jgi:hypothetical protein
MFSVCKARWAKRNEKKPQLLCNIYFCNFVAKNNQKPSYQNGTKTTKHSATGEMHFKVALVKHSLAKSFSKKY